jgi:hypothetical protein
MKNLSEKRKMVLSGLLGIGFFVLANLTNLFQGLSFTAGIIQLFINLFVFLVWLKAYKNTTGFTKFVAFWGIVFPFVMATVTLWRVVLPVIF